MSHADLYLPEYDLVIEINGPMHYQNQTERVFRNLGSMCL